MNKEEMKKEVLDYFDKIDNLLKGGDYILFEVAIALYERCDDVSVIKSLKESDIDRLRKYISTTSILNDDVGDKIDEMLGVML